jgi:hypothetical protein
LNLSGAQLLEEAYIGVFWHFLGGRCSTRVFARLFLVNVGEFLQFFFLLNGYSIFTLHFTKIMKLLVYVIVLVSIAFHLLDFARKTYPLKLVLEPYHCSTLASFTSSSLYLLQT